MTKSEAKSVAKPAVNSKSVKRRKAKAPVDRKKEEYIQVIIRLFEQSGYEVRRERLKRGAGWSVQGGLCSVFGKPVLFVDRHLSQEDQLEFLVGQYVQLGLSTEKLPEELPESIQRLLEAPSTLVA